MLPAPVAAEAAVPVRTAEVSSAPVMSLVPPPPSDAGGVSALPKVDLLDPPADEPPLGFPRTADASGSVPVGPPNVAESHIARVPAESIYGTQEAGPSPMMAPEPPASSGPADGVAASSDTEESAEDDVSISSLVMTVLIGGALGAATFLILRRFRGRRIAGRVADGLVSRIRTRAIATEDDRPSPIRAAAPSDMLAALVADRLAFREEPIELPSVIRIYGRSSALKKRRIDPPAAAVVPEPHIPLAAPAEVAKAEAKAARETSAKAKFRVDPAQPVASPAEDIPGATPFERALAARQRANR
jgi:hypothetical protein